jgi:hypothetical protein
MINAGPVAASMTADGLKKKYPWVKQNVDGYYFGGVQNGGALTASWLKYYFARLRGGRYYQNVPTALAEDRDERIYAGTTDVTLLEAHPKNNTGGEPFLDLAGDGPKDQRVGLLRFDVSDWDRAKPIGRATLWLYFAGWAGSAPSVEKKIEVARAPKAWEEGLGATSDVTGWEGQPHDDGSAHWSSHAAPAGGPPIAQVALSPNTPPGSWVSWEVTSAVRDWVRDPASNLGLRLSSPSDGPGIARFYSSEAFRTEQQVEDKGGGFRIVYRPVLILWPEETSSP